MKTKVITLDNVKVAKYISKQKLMDELREGLEVVAGAGCLFFSVFVLAMILHVYGG